MKLLICSDIYGETQQLAAFATQFGQQYSAIRCGSPYEQRLPFTSQNEAYQCFIESGGLEHYVNLLTETLKTFTPDRIIGFSAGASAVYLALAESKFLSTSSVTLFYPGQLRHHTDVKVEVDVDIIWAQESHFNVEPISHAFAKHPHVNCQMVEQQHGFMNSLTEAYDAGAYKSWSQRLRQ